MPVIRDTLIEEPQPPTGVKGLSVRVIKSFLWLGGAQVAGQAISWVGTLFVIRLLTPADYGLLAMALVFLGFFFLFADLGFGAAVVQARELGPREAGELFTTVLATNVVGAIAVFAFAPQIASFFSEPRLIPIVRVLSASFIISAAGSISQSLLVRDLEFGIKAKVDVSATVAATAVSVALALAGFGVWALVWSMITQGVIRSVSFLMLRPVVPRLSVSWARVSPLMRFGFILTLDRVINYWMSQADVAIGGRVLGTELLGFYSMAMMFAAVPMEKVLPMITQVSFAAFSRIQSDLGRVNRNVVRAVTVVSLGCFPAFLGLAAVAPDAVPVLLGERWTASIVPLQLICLIMPLRALSVVFPPALFGVGKPKVNLVNVIIGTSLMVVAFFVGVRFGLLGLAMAWVVGCPVVFSITTFRVMRALELRAREVLAPIVFPALASIIMLGAIVELRILLAGAMPPAVRLGVLVAAGAAVYGVLSWFWNRAAIEKLWLAFRPSEAGS